VTYQIEFTGTSREVLAHLPPAIKQEIKEGLRFLSGNPYAGEPLQRELKGKWKLRVGRFRIVYRLEAHRRKILVIAVGHRRSIYESFA
jgi:mRNA interferase RelE/StbE